MYGTTTNNTQADRPNAIAAAIPGIGIGLMIVDFMVQGHGGTWSLESSESFGTTEVA